MGMTCFKSLEFFDADVAELHWRTMTKEANVTRLVEQSRVLLMVGCAIAGSFADVAVEDYLTIDSHTDVVEIGRAHV